MSVRKDLVHCIDRDMPRLFPVPLPAAFSCWASDGTLHLEPLDFVPDAYCQLVKGARHLREPGFLIQRSGWPIFCEHCEPRFLASPSSLPGVNLASIQQHSPNSAALVFGIHFQMLYRQRLRAVTSTMDVPGDLAVVLLIAANVNALGFFLAARLRATVSRYPAESSFRTPTASHHWCGVTVGYHSEPTKSSL